MPTRLRNKDNDLLRRVSRSLREAGIAGEEKALLVGVSGGPDSVCLLHVLGRLRSELGLALRVAHVNHMLRGPESDADALYVEGLARSLHIPAVVERRDAEAHRAARGCSLEEAAREVRYCFFADLGGPIATGHTADDQVETVLMHIVRGAGLNGLVGLRPASTWRSAFGQACVRVVRPLLEVTRAETEAYCADHGLKPRLDSTNRSLSPLRNRIRLELLPLIRGYNPDIDDALRRLSLVSADEVSWLDDEVSRAWDAVVTAREEGLIIDTTTLLRLPLAVQRHLVRRALAEGLGDVRDIESVHIESALRLLHGPAGKRLSMPGRLSLSKGYDAATLARGESPDCGLPSLDGEYRLTVPGKTFPPGWRVTSRILSPEPGLEQAHAYRAAFDADVAGRDLTVRKRQPGERFQPLGMGQSKKLQDFMVDSRIPSACRDRVPLVCSPEGVLWVVGWRIAERAKVTGSTQNVLLIEFERA